MPKPYIFYTLILEIWTPDILLSLNTTDIFGVLNLIHVHAELGGSGSHLFRSNPIQDVNLSVN